MSEWVPIDVGLNEYEVEVTSYRPGDSEGGQEIAYGGAARRIDDPLALEHEHPTLPFGDLIRDYQEFHGIASPLRALSRIDDYVDAWLKTRAAADKADSKVTWRGH